MPILLTHKLSYCDVYLCVIDYGSTGVGWGGLCSSFQPRNIDIAKDIKPSTKRTKHKIKRLVAKQNIFHSYLACKPQIRVIPVNPSNNVPRYFRLDIMFFIRGIIQRINHRQIDPK